MLEYNSVRIELATEWPTWQSDILELGIFLHHHKTDWFGSADWWCTALDVERVILLQVISVRRQKERMY